MEDSSWYGGDPIWVTAETQGVVAASFYWVGSEAAVRGVRPMVSDHGMASFDEDDVIVLETDRIPGLRLATSGPYASLFLPGAGPARLRAARDTLRVMVGDRADVYLRSEVPERLHYRALKLVGDLLVVARGTGMLVPPERVADVRAGHTHGSDNRLPEMGALFLADGPRLPADTVVPAFESVHIYPFVAHLLGLEPAPNHGRVEVLGDLLREGERSAR